MDYEKTAVLIQQFCDVLQKNETTGYEVLTVANMLQAAAYVHIAEQQLNEDQNTEDNWADWLKKFNPDSNGNQDT